MCEYRLGLPKLEPQSQALIRCLERWLTWSRRAEWRKKGAQKGRARARARKKTDLQGKLKLLQGLQHGVEQQIHRRNLTYVHLAITRISSLSAQHRERCTWHNSMHLTGAGLVPP